MSSVSGLRMLTKSFHGVESIQMHDSEEMFNLVIKYLGDADVRFRLSPL